ncbi:MAG: DNA-3-methyladenine glycosylase [Candidatus Acididesulfobacter diazotrophicus]|uniref:Putative 3-methyladenine DNA glycosylase n=1 Tax=Candidatus Acididesulfobacter diazotrophicus TaxID=2597226 RepID=A0A519BKS2_9DELT|nr:MAG: DNA-3-methyladenine glycosylase [Candidatus Acididesulfobacter diazotrophicus]
MKYPKLQKSFFVKEDTLQAAKELLGKYLLTDINGEGITGGKIVEVEAYLGAEDKASHGYNNRRTKRNENLYKEGGNAYVYFCYGMYYLFNVVTGSKNTSNAVLIRAVEPEIGIDIMIQRKMRRLKSKGDLSINKTFNKTLKINSNINRIASGLEKNNIIINRITSGPGLLTIALGIDLRHNGIVICENKNMTIDVNDGNNFNKFNIINNNNDKNISNNDDDEYKNKLEIWLEDRSVNISNEDIIETARIGVDYAEEHALLPWRFKIKGNIWVSK